MAEKRDSGCPAFMVMFHSSGGLVVEGFSVPGFDLPIVWMGVSSLVKFIIEKESPC